MHTENIDSSKGSCCDNGRFVFKPCHNFWYYCNQWGLSNYSSCWIRHGEDGFTFPCGSAHQSKCDYSSEKRLCPIPDSCNGERGVITIDDTVNNGKILCTEIPNIEFYLN